MNWAWYTKTTAKQMRGLKCRTTVELSNMLATIPKGTVVEIDGKAGGLNVTTAACKHCGVKVYMRKVDPRDLELL